MQSGCGLDSKKWEIFSDAIATGDYRRVQLKIFAETAAPS